MRLLPLVVVGISLLAGVAFSADADARVDRRDSHPRVVLGANTGGIAEHAGASLDRFRATVGVAPKIAMYYETWDQNYSTALINPKVTDPIQRRGAVPMITWGPVLTGHSGAFDPSLSLAAIASGALDSYILRAAREARRYRHPFFVRFAHEMNGDWLPWGTGVGSNQASDYIAAWRHVVTLFREHHANNVRWVWTPNVVGPFSSVPSFENLYPGDAYVDLVGFDGYNSGVRKSGSSWTGFLDLFMPSYEAMKALTDKPMIIAETASAESGGSKARWIKHGLGRMLAKRMPLIRAVVWFDRKKERNWQVDSSSAARKEFSRVARSKRFSGSVKALLRR